MFATLVAETTATTGTGNLTLAGAVTGHNSINSAFSNDSTDAGVPFQYVIKDALGTTIESGIAHLSTSSVMVRDLQESSLQSLAVGTKYVIASPVGRGLLPGTPQIYTSASKRLTSSLFQPFTASTGTPTVDVMYYFPFYKHSFQQVDAVWVYQATAGGSAGNVKVGLYAMAPATGTPGDRIAVGAAAGTCSAASAGYIAVAFSAAKTIPPGWYFLGAVWDSNGVTSKTYKTITGSSTTGAFGILGADASGNGITGFTDATTYSSGPPATPSTLTAISTTITPVMGLRAV